MNPSRVLQKCSIIAESWVSRTRRHLFASVKFTSPVELRSWKETFPDLSNSPADYTRSLSIGCVEAIGMADAAEGGRIRTFSCAFFELVFSFPLLEDLSLGDDNDLHPPQTVLPSISPVFTGSLELLPMVHTGIAMRRLLDPPNGLRFKTLTLAWREEEDLQRVKKLDDFASISTINLSQAQKLRDATFRTGSLGIGWIAAAPGTIALTNQNLKEIAIRVDDTRIIGAGVYLRETVMESLHGEWLNLDRTLIRVWESHSIRPKAMRWAREGAEEYIERVLPEMKRGILDMIE